MPAEGLEWMPNDEVLSDTELIHLLRIAAEQLGVTSMRFTGGEPLLRKGLPGIVAETKAISSKIEISLTTNGLGLRHTAKALAEAGLDRINVSLDTLDAATYAAITRRDRLHDVLAGIDAAKAAGLDPVKINAVLLRQHNLSEAPELVRWAIENDLQMRFIEQMPLDAQHRWDRSAMITADETLELLSQHFELTPRDDRGSAPAEQFTIDGGPHIVGIIGSVTRPFCSDCNRVRLTADGQIRNCLFAREESDLRAALRGGATDEEIAQRWASAMFTKLPGHGIDDPGFLQPPRPMSAIGG